MQIVVILDLQENLVAQREKEKLLQFLLKKEIDYGKQKTLIKTMLDTEKIVVVLDVEMLNTNKVRN